MDTSLVDFGNRIGSGGTAEIYGVIGSPGLVAKLYNQPRKANFDKVQEISKRLLSTNFAHSLAIPQELIAGPGGFVGFTQRYFNNNQYLELDFWIEGALKKRLSQTQRGLSFRIQILHSLANVIARLHDHNIAIVDLKPSNVLVDRSTGEVALVDCDAFCVLDNQGNIEYPAYEVTVGYCNGDALRNGTPPTRLSYEQDSFAFAVIAFQILNNGIHPFQGVVQSNFAEHNLESLTRAGVYPYGSVPPTEVNPLPISVHGTFPEVLKEAFERSFATGRRRLEVRQWASLLNEIIDKNLIQLCNNPGQLGVHWKFAEHPCPDCRYQELIDWSSAPSPIRRSTQNGTNPQRNTGRPGPSPSRPPIPQKKTPRFSTGTIVATALAIVISIIFVKATYRPKDAITAETQQPTITTPTTPQVSTQKDSTKVPDSSSQSPSPTTKTETNSLSGLLDLAICRSAINVERTGWDNSKYYLRYVTEAQRRNLTVSKCQSLLSVDSGQTPTEQSQTQTTESNSSPEYYPFGSCDIVGSDLSKFENSTVEQCQQYCTSSAACNAFVFNKWHSMCFTKSSTTPRIIDVSADCYLNRAETTYDTTRPWELKKLRNKRFNRASILSTSQVDSFSGCEAACRKDNDCFGANFNKSTGQCQLLKSIYGASIVDPNSDAVYVFTPR